MPVLTIASAPDPSQAGLPVIITGQLTGPRHANAVISLWQRLPWQRRFHRALRVRTDALGRYSITKANGVATNRRWYVVAHGLQSRTLTQRVRALITLTTSPTIADTGEVVTISGQVTPSHAGQRVMIEQRSPTGWQVLARPRLNAASSYQTTRLFNQGGPHVLRARLAGDDKNVRSVSTLVPLMILSGIHKIQHVVVIMQENRSFDSYFGTYPGADGIPHGVCVPDPLNGGCVAPFHDSADTNSGGPHSANNATADINGGLMDGFVGSGREGPGLQHERPELQPMPAGSAELSAST